MANTALDELRAEAGRQKERVESASHALRAAEAELSAARGGLQVARERVREAEAARNWSRQ